ncbi:unnamed protein product [Darwinula stevensoni]|nr:unnamed protein product [Darwinula stevensoni]CAG0890108.1 unnamed protein product [Darwinula stevensoni]
MPSDNDIWDLAGNLQKTWEKWKELGRELGLDEDALGRVQRASESPPRSPLRRMYLLLSEWRRTEARHPSFGALREALRQMGMEQEADKIVDFICRKNCDETRREFWKRNARNSEPTDGATKKETTEGFGHSEKESGRETRHGAKPEDRSGPSRS